MGDKTTATTEHKKDNKDIQYLTLRKKQLENRKEQLKFKWKHFFLTATAFGGIFTLLALIFSYKDVKTDGFFLFILAIIVFASMGAIIYSLLIVVARAPINAELRSIERHQLKLGAEALQEKIEENFFTKLVQINFKYLDKYYLQTQEQANKSFTVSVLAAIAGFMIIIVGIVMTFLHKMEPAYLTTTAGIISEFIAAVFFYLYNRTIMKMSEYHQKVVLTQNISLALKISENIAEENKFKIQEMLVDRLTKDTNKYLAGINVENNK